MSDLNIVVTPQPSINIVASNAAMANYATITNLYNTGQNLYTQIEITSGVLESLISASIAGVGSINGKSGILTLNGAGNISISTTGQTIIISGETGIFDSLFYPLNSNPSGYTLDSNTGDFTTRQEVVFVTGDQNITGIKTFKNSINARAINFDTTQVSNPPFRDGQLYWDVDDRTLSLNTDITGTTLQIGQENYIRVVNKTTGVLENGKVIYISGSQGNRPTAYLAIAETDGMSRRPLGVVTSDIAINQEGFVTTYGLVRDLNTNDFEIGDTLYLSDIQHGLFSNQLPSKLNHVIKIGGVIVKHITQGSILVDIDRSPDFVNVYGVGISGSPTNNQYLSYSETSGLWTNKTLDTGILLNREETGVLIKESDVASTYATLTNLYDTGSNLQNQLYTLSGLVVFDNETGILLNRQETGIFLKASDISSLYATISNLYSTGQALYPRTNPSGYLTTGNSNYYLGWAEYQDTIYTSGSPYLLTGGFDVVLPNNAGVIRNTQKPIDISTFYDSGNQKILGRNGDGLNVFVYFSAAPATAIQTYMDMWIDIGSPVGELYRRTFSFPRGIGIKAGVSMSIAGFTLDTWEANGGSVYVSSNYNLNIWDIRYILTRTHKAR